MDDKQQKAAGQTAANHIDAFRRKQTNNSTSAQRRAFYQHLGSCNTLTTLHARESLGIMHPSARVMALRQRGNNIVTHWRTEPDVTGKDHRVAEHLLLTDREVQHNECL